LEARNGSNNSEEGSKKGAVQGLEGPPSLLAEKEPGEHRLKKNGKTPQKKQKKDSQRRRINPKSFRKKELKESIQVREKINSRGERTASYKGKEKN